MEFEYNSIGLAEKINGYKNRIQQLEEEHFSNTVYAFEAGLIDDSESVLEFNRRNVSVETRLNGLNAEVIRLSELLDNSEEEDDSK